MGPQWGKPFLHVFILGKKYSSPESACKLQIKLDTNHSFINMIKRIQVCTNKGPGHLQRGDNCKSGVVSFIFFFFFHEAQSQKSSNL
jgi:hypothetical protein